MNNKIIRLGALRAVLEDIALDFIDVCKKEFVVEEETGLAPHLPENAGPYYILYDGIKVEGKNYRKPVLAVSQKLFNDKKNNVIFMPAHFFMPPDPFILEYLNEYAEQFGIGSVRYSKSY